MATKKGETDRMYRLATRIAHLANEYKGQLNPLRIEDLRQVERVLHRLGADIEAGRVKPCAGSGGKKDDGRG